jgi:hypothetical protein
LYTVALGSSRGDEAVPASLPFSSAALRRLLRSSRTVRQTGAGGAKEAALAPRRGWSSIATRRALALPTTASRDFTLLFAARILRLFETAYDLILWRAFGHVKPPEER